MFIKNGLYKNTIEIKINDILSEDTFYNIGTVFYLKMDYDEDLNRTDTCSVYTEPDRKFISHIDNKMVKEVFRKVRKDARN